MVDAESPSKLNAEPECSICAAGEPTERFRELFASQSHSNVEAVRRPDYRQAHCPRPALCLFSTPDLRSQISDLSLRFQISDLRSEIGDLRSEI